MATGANYVVKFKRRRQLKTDYKRRLALVKSGIPRIVVRKSVGGATAQVVEFHHAGDKTLAGAISHELKNFGWKAGCGNLPAAYLTGFLLGTRAGKQLGGSELILDIGREHPAAGGRLFAVLKGAVDGGLKVRCEKEAFPNDKRIRGEHISECHSKLGAKGGFTKYGIEPSKISGHFDEVKKKIMDNKGAVKQ